MLTTPDEPAQCVGLLKQRQVRSSSVLTGHYRLKEDIVTIMVQRQESIKNPYRRSRRRDPAYTNNQQTFHLVRVLMIKYLNINPTISGIKDTESQP